MDEKAYASLESAIGGDIRGVVDTPHNRKKLNRLNEFLAYLRETTGDDSIDSERVSKSPDEYKGYAELYIKNFMERQIRLGNKSGGTMTIRAVSALRSVGIELDKRLRVLIMKKIQKENDAREEVKNGERATRSENYEMLRDGLERLLIWLGNCTNKEFRIKSLELLVKQKGSAKSYMRETVDHINKTMKSKHLRVLRFQVRAMLALMATTGLRGISFWRMCEGDIKEISGDLVNCGLAIYYKSYKTGSSGRGVTLLTRVVPHSNPHVCPIICLYQYMQITGSREYIFRNSNGTKDSWWKRASSVLQVAGYATNLESAFSSKKFHAFRGYCTTFLMERGAHRDERHNHLGWKREKVDIESEHYLLDTVQLNSNPAAFIAAGRLTRTCTNSEIQPPPPFWKYLDKSGCNTLCEKVCYVAAAAGFHCGNKMEVDPEIAKVIVSDSGTKRKREDSGVLELALNLERAKNARCDSGTLVEAVEELERIFNDHLKPHCMKDDFPSLCKKVVIENMAPILDKWAMPNVNKGMGLGLDLANGFGRDLVVCLRLAACNTIKVTFRKGSWLTFVKSNSKYFKAHHGIIKPVWSEFRKAIMS